MLSVCINLVQRKKFHFTRCCVENRHVLLNEAQMHVCTKQKTKRIPFTTRVLNSISATVVAESEGAVGGGDRHGDYRNSITREIHNQQLANQQPAANKRNA